MESKNLDRRLPKLKLNGCSFKFISGRTTTVLRQRGSESSPELPNSSSGTVRIDKPR